MFWTLPNDDKNDKDAEENLFAKTSFKPTPFSSTPDAAPVSSFSAHPVSNAASTAQECMISAGSSLTGNIETDDNVVLAGKLVGNLNSVGTVRVTGSVLGDVSADCVELVGGKVEGNITAVKSISVDQAGSVKGNLTADSISLKAGTTVNGDLTSTTAYIERGANLHGKLNIGK